LYLGPAQSPTIGTTSEAGSAASLSQEDSSILFHFAGYGDATYIDAQGEAGSAGFVTLAPIFHLLAYDRILLETELELQVDDHGRKSSAIEYATASWLINDHFALVAGKLLSPVGYFLQNLHPSWINKMASKPAGFGHGGANPISDVGLQVRGGADFGNGQQLNYAIYNGNGPRLGVEVEPMEMGGTGEAELALDLDSEGKIRNPDGKRVTGGRVGWLPIPALEVGASFADGDVRLDAGELSAPFEPARSYRADGIDLAWHPTSALELRGEWIRQRVGAAPVSAAPEQATWRAWYVQAAYRFGAGRWEAVIRRGDSVSPHAESTFKQTALGLNYLFRPNTLLKLTWELNDSADQGAGSDRVLVQFAYGF